MRRLYPIAVAALCILCTACSVVRKLPEGSYLVQKVTIEDDRNLFVGAERPSSGTSKSVSYTHLDVYKRQALTSGATHVLQW